jgi:hypothetical protein
MSRPEYVKCVQDNHRDHDGRSWCGQVLNKFDFAFVSIEHAAFNGRAGGRLVACSECTAAIIKALTNGQENAP